MMQPEELVRVLGLTLADADELCDAMVGAEVSGWGLIEATSVLERASAMMPGGCGAPIELVPDGGDVVLAVYVNVGDAYSPTLLWDNGTGEFVVGCWADVLEEWEQENGNQYPSVDDLTAELEAERDNLDSPLAPENDVVVHDDSEEGIDVRLQCSPDGWALRTGDSQYDHDHRGAWGSGYLTHDTDCRSLAEEMIEEAREHAAQG